MSRRAHIVRTRTQPPGPAMPLPTESAAGNPAFGSIRGDFMFAPESGTQRLPVSNWWQTPRLDDYVLVEPGNYDIHIFKVRQRCDLLVQFSLDFDLPEDDAETGHVRVDIQTRGVDNHVVGYVDNVTYARGHTEGPFKRLSFVNDDSVYVGGVSISESFRFDFTPADPVLVPDPYFELFATVRNAMVNTDLYGTWKMTVILLDESTERSLGGIG